MLPETSAILAHSQTGPVSSKRRRAMAQLKQIPVSMLSGFLGSGAFTTPCAAARCLIPHTIS